MTRRAATRVRSAMVAVLVALLPVSGGAQEPHSAAPAQELARLLDSAQLDAIAAKDPAEPDRFVAALYFAGSELLVVSARYVAPTLLIEKIKNKEYRDVYVDLNSAFVPESKIFIEDLNTDGIRLSSDQNSPHDRYERGAALLSLDGAWRQSGHNSEADYQAAVRKADSEYAAMLKVLLTELQPAP